MKKLIFLIIGIALLTVACRAEMNVVVDINEDRSGTASIEFGLDDEFRGIIESTGGSVDDLFGDLDFGTEGGSATTRTEGDMTFTGVTKEFADVNDVLAELVGMADSDEPLFQAFAFTMDEEAAELTANVTAPEQDLGDVGIDPSALTGDLFSANFIVGMPGTVVDHNADEVLADGRLRWDLPILGGDKDIYAKSEFGGGSLWWLWIVLGVVLVVGTIAIIAATVLGRRQSKQAVSDAASQYPQPAVPESIDPSDSGDANESAVQPDDTSATDAAGETDETHGTDEPDVDGDVDSESGEDEGRES